MNIDQLRQFFGVCSIINVGLMALSFVIMAFGLNWVHRMHGKLFPMSKEAFTIIMYSFMGIFKLFIIVFNIVPYLALSLRR